MKRDDWQLGSGISAGDDAFVMFDNNCYLCHVIKVSGGTIKGHESGNVLIRLLEGPSEGEEHCVFGSSLQSIE